MWIAKASLIIAALVRLACILFALDILAWTFGAEVIPPLDALLCFGIWFVPLLASYFFPAFSRFLVAPLVLLMSASEPKAEEPE